MSVLIVVIGAGVILFISYLTYGKFLSKKVFVLDDTKVTPSVELNDGQDYVPAKKSMLLGQHFSAIAAAGPINGPILASVMFGWLPAMLWVLIGSIFIGGISAQQSQVNNRGDEASRLFQGLDSLYDLYMGCVGIRYNCIYRYNRKFVCGNCNS